jgi:alpha-N-arabinofuranosidase
METTGLVLQLYRAHFGQTPLLLQQDFGASDVAAALTADRRALTFAVVNPTSEEIQYHVTLSGGALAGKGTRWHITGPDEFAHNEPGKPRVIDIQTTRDIDASILRVPPLSATVFELPLK